MRISYRWLQSFFKDTLPEPQKLADLLTMRSFEVEDVIRKGKDYIFETDVLPNRAHDCLSHFGIARECAALLNSKAQVPNVKSSSKFKNKNENILHIAIEEESLCPRYSAYVIEGVKITESPDWIKERLAAMGQKSINNVVDITNYVMWELGQPLHAFDFEKIQGGKMIIRLSEKGEKLETLDGSMYELGEDTIVIEDNERIIDLAGIKGGANTQIEQSTSTIIFQAAIFDPSRIRRTMQTLGIRTEASLRYMHGFDPELPPQALDRAVALLQETNPEIKVLQKIDAYSQPRVPKKIVFDSEYANRLLGVQLTEKEIVGFFERLGFLVELRNAKSQILVTVPTWRLDIAIPEDLIEELGRLYGYERIQASAPYGTLVTPKENERVLWRAKARRIVAGFGFSEVYNYSLGLKMKPAFDGFEQLEVQNPVSEEFRYARIMLLPGVLKNIASNSRYFDTVQLFEFGKVFYGENGKIEEGENCALALYDINDRDGKEGFYQIKGYADEFLHKLGITDFYYDPTISSADLPKDFLHPERAANIMVDQKFAGFIGEVHPAIRFAFDIKGRVFCTEFDFDKIEGACEEEHIYQKPSKFPEVVRDIALLVPRGAMVEEVENVINAVSGQFLRDVDLFDMYEGEEIGEGVKNLAFHLIFQSDERTLTSNEVEDTVKKIERAIREKGWEVRE